MKQLGQIFLPNFEKKYKFYHLNLLTTSTLKKCIRLVKQNVCIMPSMGLQ